MKLSTTDVYKMANLADWKLREYIRSFKHQDIIMTDIIKKAEDLRREAMLCKNTLLTNKFDDLIEFVRDEQSVLKAAQNQN